MDKYKPLKQECYEANMQLPKLGLVIYTFGNVSCIDRKTGVYAIKPSGVDYEKLNWQDIVIVDLNDNIIDGSMRPSSDTKTHTLLYNAFRNIGGIVHT
ncbi:MAG: class II aldolase/adducin family protein, partial [Victivallaceae bacterium]|nr:class II aldolase/adducin family protein [Victivallaceae bacterium]